MDPNIAAMLKELKERSLTPEEVEEACFGGQERSRGAPARGGFGSVPRRSDVRVPTCTDLSVLQTMIDMTTAGRWEDSDA